MDKVKLLYKCDKSCEMEQLYVNDTCVAGGNYHDNYCLHRLFGIISVFKILGIEYEVVKDYEWKYE